MKHRVKIYDFMAKPMGRVSQYFKRRYGFELLPKQVVHMAIKYGKEPPEMFMQERMLTLRFPGCPSSGVAVTDEQWNLLRKMAFYSKAHRCDEHLIANALILQLALQLPDEKQEKLLKARTETKKPGSKTPAFDKILAAKNQELLHLGISL